MDGSDVGGGSARLVAVGKVVDMLLVWSIGAVVRLG